MTDTDDLMTPAITAALDAYRSGYMPVPLLPGEKRPSVASWTDLDFDDERELRRFFRSEEQTHVAAGALGVGIRLGQHSGGLIDIDLDHPKAIRLRSMLPRTAARHGRPSRPDSHFWYVATDDLPAYRKFSLPDGSTLMELRSTGHQTVIPPSMHPEQERYVWTGEPWGGSSGPLRLRGKVLQARVLTMALVATLLDCWPKQGGRHDAYLALAGGLLRFGGLDGDTGGVHPLWESNLPGVIATLSEATLDEDGPRARVSEVFDSTLKKLRAGSKVQGFGTLSELIGKDHTDLVVRYARDVENLLGYPSRKAPQVEEIELVVDPEEVKKFQVVSEERARKLQDTPSEDRDPLAERTCAWESVDLKPYLADPHVGPKPGVLRRTDGVALLYPGRVNSLYGESESGKTWIALHAVQQVLDRGGRVVIIDCEDGPTILIQRLRLLAVPDDPVAEQIAYINPDAPLGSLMVDRWGQPKVSESGKANETAFTAVLDQVQPELILLDGLTVLYSLHGLKPNDAADTERITGWLRRLTNHERRTVLMIDHTSKNTSAGGGPTGSQHKNAMVQGTALHVIPLTKPRRGHLGSMELHIGKDRPGQVREHLTSDASELIADVSVDSRTEGRVSVRIDPPDADEVTVDPSTSKYPRKDSKAAKPPKEDTLLPDMNAIRSVLLQGRMSKEAVQLAYPGDISANRVAKALRELHALNVVQRISGNGGGWELVHRPDPDPSNSPNQTSN